LEEKEKQTVAQIDRGSMERVLGLSDVFAVGYGDLGASIYYALGITALYALGATPIALLLAGIVFACTALTYAEMTSMTKEAGGSASFTRAAFNDLISFISGWALLLDFIVTIAISSYSVAPYLGVFFPVLRLVWPKLLCTVCLIGALFVINFFGARHSTRLSWVLTTLTLVTQVVIVIIGMLFLVHFEEFWSHLKINGANAVWSPTWKGFWKGTAMAMVAYTGIESMAQLSGETKRPGRTVPKAMLIAMGILLLMYLCISTVALSAVTPETLSTTYLEDPLAGIVAALPIGGKILAPWIGLLAAVILIVSANAGIMGASRLSFRMGERYQLPRIFYHLHGRFKTPYVALAIFSLFAICIVLWSRGKLSFLADLYNFGAMLAFFSAHLSLIIQRIKSPKRHRPFKSPLNIPIGKGRSLPFTAILGALATLATWILVVITKPEGRYLGICWLIVGLVSYLALRKKAKIKPTAQIEIERIKVPEFKHVSVKKILVPTRGGMETETVQVACEVAKMHGAEVIAVNVIEVPFSLSMHSPMVHRQVAAEGALKRADAIAREYGISMDLKIVRARSVAKAVVEMATENEVDLLILGGKAKMMHKGAGGLGRVTEEIIRSSPMRVFVCLN